jgi:hypothetical protein
MFSRIKKDLENAVEKIRWFANLFSERVRIELTVFKLLYRSEELKKRRDELLMGIGLEVYELRGKNRNIYARSEVTEALKELERLDPEIKEIVDKASEISRIVT